MVILGVTALAFGGVAIAAIFWDQAPHQGGRYDEIARMISRNLKFGRHFTWAVTGGTIKAVRPHIGTGDVAVLARMLRDKRSTVRVAAASLLALLGPGGEAALKRVAAAGDIPAAMHARDGLMHIAQCRDPRVGNLDRTLCPGPAR